MTRQTYTLAEVAGAYLPPEWTDGARWLARRLNAGQLRGIKMGRTWMMTQAHIDHMLEVLSNKDRVTEPEPTAKPEPTVVSFAEALSPRSRARLQRVSE
jgi:hypothetical protein